MMKKVMFALCFMFGGIVVVTAQDTQTQDTTSNQYRTETQSQFPQDAQGQSQDMMGQQDRERIQVTELPDEVKRSLEGQEYRGWLISGAFKAQGGQSSDSTSSDASQQPSNAATGTEDEEVYIVELKNGAETKTIGFDSKGEVVEGIGGDQNSQLNGQTEPSNQNNDMNQPETSPNNDQTDQSQSSQDQSQSSQSATQSTSTPSGQSTQTDQTTTDTQTQPEQSTETQTDTQTDQSRVNGPK